MAIKGAKTKVLMKVTNITAGKIESDMKKFFLVIPDR